MKYDLRQQCAKYKHMPTVLFEWRMMEIAPLRIHGTGRVLRSLREVMHLMLRLAGAVTRTCLVYQLVFANTAILIM